MLPILSSFNTLASVSCERDVIEPAVSRVEDDEEMTSMTRWWSAGRLLRARSSSTERRKSAISSAVPDLSQPLRSSLTHVSTRDALPTDDQRLHVRIPCRRPIHVLNRHDVVLQSRILKAQEVADASGSDGDGLKEVGVAFRYEKWVVCPSARRVSGRGTRVSKSSYRTCRRSTFDSSRRRPCSRALCGRHANDQRCLPMP